ncbi:histone deacetylase HDT1 [Jatropha curcas]|uniref:histone deacetylase HDT1 n=1 Tax=Jatropha curcas TaxID=180498 RepID=UPI0018934617|nr:histone deacetylase HDT1 [Jatropha curcas]
MEFWGVEVKAGEPLKVKPESDSILHLSQAALGESKKEKGNESVPLFVKVDDKKLVLGTLSTENIPQISLDLVFEKEVELSHNWKNGSVYFCGYQTLMPDEEDMYSDEDSEEDKPLPLVNADNGKPHVEPVKAIAGKPKPDSPAKQKPKPAEPSKGQKAEDESDEDESDDDDSDDEDDESDSEDGSEEVSALYTFVATKRMTIYIFQWSQKFFFIFYFYILLNINCISFCGSDGKKGGHTATPHPAKGAAKTAAVGSNAKSPKSGGQFSCKSCDRSFGSDGALQSHSKAKHGGK